MYLQRNPTLKAKDKFGRDSHEDVSHVFQSEC